jgi:hypothetical protein
MRFSIFVFLSLSLVSSAGFGADDAPYNSATISGLGARNIGSATMSGRISAIAGVKEPSGKITLFVGAARGGGWETGVLFKTTSPPDYRACGLAACG